MADIDTQFVYFIEHKSLPSLVVLYVYETIIRDEKSIVQNILSNRLENSGCLSFYFLYSAEHSYLFE